jgi:two-component system C4-dicarboxylate transport response regulator DctD
MSGRRHAIVVEDDASVQRALGRVLRIAGFEPLAFDSAEHLLRAGELPDAAFMVVDIQLPGVSGLVLVERLAATRPLPPVIFITASDDPELHEGALRLGGWFLAKPFAPEALLDTVHRACSTKSTLAR